MTLSSRRYGMMRTENQRLSLVIAEGMYNRTVTGLSLAGQLEVVKR